MRICGAPKVQIVLSGSWLVSALLMVFLLQECVAVAQTPLLSQPLPQSTQPRPEEATRAIVALFDKYQVVGMNAAHRIKDLDDFILSLVRNPNLPNVVDDIVVECGNALYQPILDRYIAGEDVPLPEARKIWRNTTQPMCGVSAFYAQFFPLIRRINQSLPAGQRLRVVAGDPPIDWEKVRTASDVTSFLEQRDAHIAAVMEKEVLAKNRKALMLFGTGHLFHGLGNVPPALQSLALNESAVARYEKRYPGVTFVIDVAPGSCGDSRLLAVAALEARLRAGPVPSLVHTTDVALPNPGASNRLDGYLYLGPLELMLAEPRPASVFVDSEYMAELRRRAAFRPGPINDQIDPEKIREQDASAFLNCRE